MSDSPLALARRLPWRSLVAYGLLFLILQTGWEALRGSAVERFVIDDATAHVAAGLIRALTPGIPAQSHGSRIVAPGRGINILNGCEGTEVLFLLLPALCIAPLGARRRLIAIVVGTLLVWVLNQIRVVGLFYALRSNVALFDLLHGTIAPLLLVAAVTAFFIAITRPAARDEGPLGSG